MLIPNTIVQSTTPFALIETKILSVAGSIDFQSIPASYTNLRVVAYIRGNAAVVELGLRLRFNNDSGSNYDSSFVQADGSAAGGDAAVAVDYIGFGKVPGTSAPANRFGLMEATIPAYALASNFKVCTGTWNSSSGTATTDQVAGAGGGLWRSTAAINRLFIFHSSGSGDWVAGSVASLYGLM